MTESIVVGSLVWIRENGVSLLNFLEFVFSIEFFASIWVITSSESPECILQVFFCRCALNIENFVIVSFVCQRSTQSMPTGAPLKPHVEIRAKVWCHRIDNSVRREDYLHHKRDSPQGQSLTSSEHFHHPTSPSLQWTLCVVREWLEFQCWSKR